MVISIVGIFINGDPTGVVWTGGHAQNVIAAVTSPLLGTVSIAGKTDGFTLPINFSGVQALPDFWGATYFALSNPADAGKIHISWQPL